MKGEGRQTIQQLVDTYLLDPDVIILGLEKNGITVDLTQTVKEAANANNTDPHTLFELIYGLVHAN